jgi:hypothetical protein
METLPPYEALMRCWNTSRFGSSGHLKHNNGKAWPQLLFAVTSKMCVCPNVVPHIAAGNVTKHIKYTPKIPHREPCGVPEAFSSCMFRSEV